MLRKLEGGGHDTETPSLLSLQLEGAYGQVNKLTNLSYLTV